MDAQTKATNQRWSEHISGSLPVFEDALVIGVLEGEGVGPELVAQSLELLNVVAPTVGRRIEVRPAPPVDDGGEDDHLQPALAEFCREIFAAGGAVFAGPVGGRFVYNIRRAARLKPEHLQAVDVLIVRANAGGAYQGTSTLTHDGQERVARHEFSYTEGEVQRLLDAAAKIAASRRGRLTVVAKPGGLPALTELWSDCATTAGRAAGIEHALMHADHAAYCLVQNACDFDVVAAPNVFGDVLSDVGALLLGARGLTFGGSFGTTPGAYYQTNHGGACDLVGVDRANPVGQILSLAMLLRESFGLFDQADLIEGAVRAVWRDGWRTHDLVEAGCRLAGTRQMSELVLEQLRDQVRG